MLILGLENALLAPMYYPMFVYPGTAITTFLTKLFYEKVYGRDQQQVL